MHASYPVKCVQTDFFSAQQGKHPLYKLWTAVKHISDQGTGTFLSPAAFDCHSGLDCRCLTAVFLSWVWQAIKAFQTQLYATRLPRRLGEVVYTTRFLYPSPASTRPLAHTSRHFSLKVSGSVLMMMWWCEKYLTWRTYRCIIRRPMLHQGTRCSQNYAAEVHFITSGY